MNKICTKCIIEKDSLDFPKNENRCISCRKEYYLRYKEKTKKFLQIIEKITEKRKKQF